MATAAEKRTLIKRRRQIKEITGQRLPSARKQPKRPPSGKGLERTYFGEVLNLLDPYFRIITEEIIPKIPELIEAYQAQARTDDVRQDVIVSDRSYSIL